MPISIDDVARRAGVSIATVSRAVRGLPNVAPATRLTVLDAVKALGYVPSAPAVSLASGRTRTVSLVCPSITRWFFAEVIEGIELALRRSGLDVLLHTLESRHSLPRTRFEPEVLRGRIDAAVVCGMSLDETEAIGLAALGCPVVFVSVDQPGFACILIDDRAAARRATEHLLELGHRNIAHVGGTPEFDEPRSPLAARRAGWREALEEAGCAPPGHYYVEADFTAGGARAGAAQLLTRYPEITAVVADSDEMAFGVLRAARDLGRRIPADLSVVGFDGHELCDIWGLTTMAQPVRLVGELAASMLLAGIDPQTPMASSNVIIPARLEVRESTAPPR